MEVPVAVLLGTRNRGRKLITDRALLVDQFSLLVIEVDDQPLSIVEHVVGPECAVDVDVHVHLVWD